MKILSVLLLTVLCSACGSYKAPNQMAQPGIVPVMSDMMPNNINAGTQGLTLTVNGSNFNTNAVVTFNGLQQPTQFVTAKQLIAMIPAIAVATPGMFAVTVTNPGSSTPGGPYGGGGVTMSQTSASMTFTVN